MKQSKPDLVLTVFKFFASQALAIVLLSVLAVALAAGTIIESLYGATAAQKLIYFNLWFEMLLFILGVNVIFSTLTRLPWKKQHIGFLLTHAGIILILVGSLLTSRFMIDGSVVIEEGKTSDQIILNKPLVLLHHLHEGVGYWVEFRPPALAWNGRRPLKLRPEPKNGLKAALLAYYPHAQAKQGAVVQAGGPAALSVSLQNKFADAGGWLVQDNGPMSAMQLGPAFIHFAKNEVTPESAKSPEKGFLLVTHPQGTQKVPIEKALKEKIKINQTPFELKIVRFFSHAVVENGKLTNRSEKMENPACEILVEGKGVQENHIVFALFPDFPTIHGRPESQTGITFRYEMGGQAMTHSQNQLRFFTDEKKQTLLFQLIHKGDVSKPQKIETGKEYETGWMGLTFRVPDWKPEARIVNSYEPRPMPKAGTSPHPAALFQFSQGAVEDQFWMTRGSEKTFLLGEDHYRLSFDSQIIPLGFKLYLEDFMITYYPGSNQPAEYKSKVKFTNPSTGQTEEALIQMNEPLIYKGMRIYQSGYEEGRDGRPDISVFSAAKDIGIPFKYIGAIVMILGVITIFFIKQFSNSKPLFNNLKEQP